MCIPELCWPFAEVHLKDPPKPKKKEEDKKRYIYVKDGAHFYPVSLRLIDHLNSLHFRPFILPFPTSITVVAILQIPQP
jgi:hypothetical protein